MAEDRKQVTIQIYPDRHPELYSRYFDKHGNRRMETKPSQEIPLLAEMQLSVDSKGVIMETLSRIEGAILNLKVVGIIDDDQEKELKERASSVKRKIPIMR